MKTRIKERKFYNKMYDCYISYLIGGTVPQLISFINRHHGEDAPLFSWGTQFQWGPDADTTNAYQFHVNYPLGHGEVFYVWLHELTPNLLFHETFHLLGDILYTRGLRYTYASEETYAYLGGEIFEQIFKLVKGSFKQRK